MQTATPTRFGSADGNRAGLAIQVQALSKLYGDFPALQSVNFEVAEGGFLGLLGRNGAGKSTLLKLLALLTQPSSGTLRLGGLDPRSDPVLIRRQIGFLGHNTFLYDELTAQENLLFYGSLYGVANPRRICGQMLDLVELTPFAGELVRNFSRGMRQRLAIGRLFLHQPALLLLDEPFTGLDDRAATLLESLLQQAQQQGKTVVLCTHQLEQALQYAQRLLILDKGRIGYCGPNHPERADQMRALYQRCAG